MKRHRTNQGISRPPLERMALISRWLRNGKRFTTATLAAELETSTKTIQRDIDFMRDRLGYVMEFEMIKGEQIGTCSWFGRPPKERIL